MSYPCGSSFCPKASHQIFECITLKCQCFQICTCNFDVLRCYLCLGLQYLEEIETEGDPAPAFYCTICKVQCDYGNHSLHLTSAAHYLNVLVRFLIKARHSVGFKMLPPPSLAVCPICGCIAALINMSNIVIKNDLSFFVFFQVQPPY